MTMKELISRLQRQYRGSAFTGHWAGRALREQAINEALKILTDAFERTIDQDMRTEEVFDALAFLEGEGGKAWPFRSFRQALDNQDPRSRWQNVNAALNGIRGVFGRPAG